MLQYALIVLVHPILSYLNCRERATIKDELDAFWKDKANVEEAKKVFAKYDADNSGYLDRDEFAKFARDFWKYLESKGVAKFIQADKSMVEPFLDSRFDLLDVDKDGTISFEEFSTKIHLMAAH